MVSETLAVQPISTRYSSHRHVGMHYKYWQVPFEQSLGLMVESIRISETSVINQHLQGAITQKEDPH